MRKLLGLILLGTFSFAGEIKPLYLYPPTKGYEFQLNVGQRFFERKSAFNPRLTLDLRVGYPFLVGFGAGYIGGGVDGYDLMGRLKYRKSLWGRVKGDLLLSVVYSHLRRGGISKGVTGLEAGVEILKFTYEEVFFGLGTSFGVSSESKFNYWRLNLVVGF